MSYILEALRRAERERAQGQGVAVTAADGQPVAPAPSRGPLMTAIVALLAINALVIGVLLLRNKPEPAAVQLTVDARSPAPTATTSPAPAMQSVAPIDEPVVEQGVASMDDLGAAGETDEAAPEPKTVTEAPAPAPRGRVTFATKPLTPHRDVQVPRAQDAQERPDIEDDLVEDPAPAAPPPKAVTVTPSVKPLSDMSAAYQATFPQFVMEVHVYDAQPQRRFAIIGGQRYHEGDSLPQGARLVGIVPEGLVVDFRNETVLYPIGRH